jgi:hypothetical protein
MHTNTASPLMPVIDAPIVFTGGSALDDLAEMANAAHRAVEHATRTMLSHARDCGETLIIAKQKVGHGKFSTWVTENCECSASQARRYMRLAKQWPILTSLCAEPSGPKRSRAADMDIESLSIRQALEILADAKPKTAKPQTTYASVFEGRCEACGSRMIRTSARFHTCPNCPSKLYHNEDFGGEAKTVYPVVQALQWWERMGAEDRVYFLGQVTKDGAT